MSPVTHPSITLVASLTLMVGCASWGGGGGGDDNLPNRGIVPYDRLLSVDEETAVFALESTEPSTLIYVEPHATITESEEVLLFAEARDPATGLGSVVYCPLDETLTCETPSVAVDPNIEGRSWLEGRAGAPFVLRQESSWLMAFAYGAGKGIAVAWSIDGVTFELDPTPLLEASGEHEHDGIDAPSLVQTETGYRLYYEGRDADGVARILVADGDFGLVFERVGIALEGGVGCRDVAGQPETCWDALGVGSPDVRLGTTAAGRTVVRLFYTGMGATGYDLGFAASWDGVNFERFVYNPVVASSAVERHPSNVRLGDRYLLFFEERVNNTLRGIGVAINDAIAPSEDL